MQEPLQRRAFLGPGEIPKLLLGSLTGRASDLRRIVGARRAGRIGGVFAVVSGTLAFGTAGLPAGLLGYALLCAPGLVLASRWAELSAPGYLRVSAWALSLPLLAAAAVRIAAGGGSSAGWVALAAGHVLLWHGLRGGLR